MNEQFVLNLNKGYLKLKQCATDNSGITI